MAPDSMTTARASCSVRGEMPEPAAPSREKRENGNYDILFCADIDNEVVKVSVSGDMDPGYGSTSKMITESALCLLFDCPDLAGGIYTTAPAMGQKLIDRLEEKHVMFFAEEKEL